MTPDWTDDQPIYRQLKDKVLTAIMDGALREGEALPSVRSVSADLQINPLTASKAYQELVADGFVEKRRGLGMYVIDGARAQVLEAERKRFMQDVWPRVLETIHRLGFDAEALLKNGTSQKGQ
ncbi:MAG: GntR family transcriptional regulator [Robiginitomaculum sp.]|nr:MAG: GntR family transcriptional regulator [Robiginitomaculum sp.]